MASSSWRIWWPTSSAETSTSPAGRETRIDADERGRDAIIERDRMMHVTAIVAAGGSGRRVGADVPKQFLDLGGRTVLERIVAAFATHPAVHDVIVVLPPTLVSSAPTWIDGRAPVRVVA